MNFLLQDRVEVIAIQGNGVVEILLGLLRTCYLGVVEILLGLLRTCGFLPDVPGDAVLD